MLPLYIRKLRVVAVGEQQCSNNSSNYWFRLCTYNKRVLLLLPRYNQSKKGHNLLNTTNKLTFFHFHCICPILE